MLAKAFYDSNAPSKHIAFPISRGTWLQPVIKMWAWTQPLGPGKQPRYRSMSRHPWTEQEALAAGPLEAEKASWVAWMPAPTWRSWRSDGFQAEACRSRIPKFPAKEHNPEVEKQMKFIQIEPNNPLSSLERKWLGDGCGWTLHRGHTPSFFLWQKPKETLLRVNEVRRFNPSEGPSDSRHPPWASPCHHDGFPLVLNFCLASGSLTEWSSRIS